MSSPQVPQVDPNDAQFELYELKEVSQGPDGGFFLNFTDGVGIGCPPIPDGHAPRPGDAVRLYGKGLGYPVRGIVIAGHVAFYRTMDEEAAYRKEEGRKADQQSRATFDADLPKISAAIADLSGPLQQRISGFVIEWKKIDQVHTFLPYELETCVAADKIAKWAAQEEGREAADFKRLSLEDQVSVVDGIRDLTGNMVGHAIAFAAWMKRDPEAVPKMHAVCCVIVGCEQARCFSVRGES